MKSRIDPRNYRTDTVLYCTNQVIKHETSVSCKKFEKIVSKINVKNRATIKQMQNIVLITVEYKVYLIIFIFRNILPVDGNELVPETDLKRSCKKTRLFIAFHTLNGFKLYFITVTCLSSQDKLAAFFKPTYLGVPK